MWFFIFYRARYVRYPLLAYCFVSSPWQERLRKALGKCRLKVFVWIDL